MDLKTVNTISDFLELYGECVSNEDSNLLNDDFELNRNQLLQKINPILQFAKPKDAEEITQIFKDVYHGNYPYKELEDVQHVRNMIESPNYEWILFKIGINKTIGCLLADVEFEEKKGVFHGFMIREKYQKIVDALMGCLGAITYLWKKYKNKILIWSAEVRTNDTAPQYFGMMCGIKPIAFLPNKDIFFNHTESNILIIAYDEKVLIKYRTEDRPHIIRQVLNCYVYSSKRYSLDLPIIENPNHNYDLEMLNEIENKIVKKSEKDKFGNEQITFSIKNSDSYFKFLYNPNSKNIEKTRYEIKNLEELFVFLEKLKELIQKYDANYFQCFVSAYKPKHQKVFNDAGFNPMGYVPCWKYKDEEGIFEDHIVFSYYKGNIDKEMKLIPEASELLKELNIVKEDIFSEPLEAIRS